MLDLLNVSQTLLLQAQNTGQYGLVTGILCDLIIFLLGPYVWVAGVLAMVIGGCALAFEEGKMAKIIGYAMLGIGIAVAAPKVMDKMVPGGVNVCAVGQYR